MNSLQYSDVWIGDSRFLRMAFRLLLKVTLFQTVKFLPLLGEVALWLTLE